MAWDRFSITAEIHRRGSTFAELGRVNEKTTVDVQQSMKRAFPKGDRIISKFLNVPLHELWPDRYDNTGNRKYKRSLSTETKTSSRLKSESKMTGANHE